jgi:NADPH2 dehydrogenase
MTWRNKIMSMKNINDSIKIRHRIIKNRICLPPMVCFKYANENGTVSDANIEHYRRIAKGGAGLMILEAACINPNGKLAPVQLGIWRDEQIEGLKKITDAVHQENGTIVVQIHHAGVVGVAEKPLCPSTYKYKTKIGKEMTADDIKQTQKDFIDAAKRAYDAGFDGVELHGCHNYLICQFLNNRVNKRLDRYGTSPIDFVLEIIDEIRKVTPEDFIVGIRLGGFEPTLEAAIGHSISLDRAGIDFIDVSYGFGGETDEYAPVDFPYENRIYAAMEIKKKVSVPVFAVGNIRTLEDALGVLNDTCVDMVDIGRSMLVDPEWTSKALKGQKPGFCVGCPSCKWNNGQCAGEMLMEKV